MGYANTFIEIADDCMATKAVVPQLKNNTKTMAVLQYEMITQNPYKYTEEDISFETFAMHHGISKADWPAERKKFFSKDQPCLRPSALGKIYGWGIHCDANGKVAIYPMESKEYKQFATDPKLKHLKAMRSARAA